MPNNREEANGRSLYGSYIGPRMIQETHFREMSKLRFFSSSSMDPSSATAAQDAEKMLDYLNNHAERDFSFTVRRILFEKTPACELVDSLPEDCLKEYDCESLVKRINKLRTQSEPINAEDREMIYRVFETLPVSFYERKFEESRKKSKVSSRVVNKNIVTQKGASKRNMAFRLAFVLELSPDETDKLLTEEMDTFGIDYFSKEESVYAYCLNLPYVKGEKTPYQRAEELLSQSEATLKELGILGQSRIYHDCDYPREYNLQAKKVLLRLKEELQGNTIADNFLPTSEHYAEMDRFENENELMSFLVDYLFFSYGITREDVSKRIKDDLRKRGVDIRNSLSSGKKNDGIKRFKDEFELVDYLEAYLLSSENCSRNIRGGDVVSKELYQGIPVDDSGNMLPSSQSRFPSRLTEGILRRDMLRKLSVYDESYAKNLVKKSYIEIMLFRHFTLEYADDPILGYPTVIFEKDGNVKIKYRERNENNPEDTPAQAFIDELDALLSKLHLGRFHAKSTLDQLCEFCLRQEKPIEVFNELCRQAYTSKSDVEKTDIGKEREI